MDLLNNDEVAQSLEVLWRGAPAYDLLAISHARSVLKNLGEQQLEELVNQTEDVDLRIILLQLYLETSPRQASQKCLTLIEDHSLHPNLRMASLCSLRNQDTENVSARHYRSLLELLKSEIERDSTVDLAFIRELFRTLTQHRDIAPRTDAINTLYHLTIQCKAPLRAWALGLLGFFGEIDLVERLCMLPSYNEEEKQTLQSAIESIIARPINIVLINPQNFEHLMASLFTQMNYQLVSVTSFTRDKGIDIRANGPENCPVYIQCKRYTPKQNTNSVKLKRKDIEDFDASIAKEYVQGEEKQIHAIFATTATSLSSDAKSYLDGRHSSWPLRVICGSDLLQLMDEHLQAGKYQIESPLAGRTLPPTLKLFE